MTAMWSRASATPAACHPARPVVTRRSVSAGRLGKYQREMLRMPLSLR